eukprot:1434751-Pyramimonas_sp.AAC.1
MLFHTSGDALTGWWTARSWRRLRRAGTMWGAGSHNDPSNPSGPPNIYARAVLRFRKKGRCAPIVQNRQRYFPTAWAPRTFDLFPWASVSLR